MQGITSFAVVAFIVAVALAVFNFVPLIDSPEKAGTLTSLKQESPTQETVQEPVIPTDAPATVIYVEQEPTPTPIPFPTLVPTPMVTRVPVTTWPAVTDTHAGQAPYTLYYAQDGSIKSLTLSSESDPLQLTDATPNLHEATGLYLAEQLNLAWGDVSPDENLLALVLSSEVMPSMDTREDEKRSWYIYLYDVTTGTLEQLVENGQRPIWSHDGTRIAFYNLATRSLGIIDVKTRTATDIFTLPNDPENDPSSENQLNYFTWSPDDQFVAAVQTYSDFAAAGGIWMVDSATGKNARQLVDMKMNAVTLSWSPVANQILFRSTEGEHLSPEINFNVWLLDGESGQYRQMTSDMQVLDSVWSPDGSTILLSASQALEGKLELYNLWLLTPASDKIQRLTDDSAANNFNLSWTSDGMHVVFDRFTTDNSYLGLWELDLVHGKKQLVYSNKPGQWILR